MKNMLLLALLAASVAAPGCKPAQKPEGDTMPAETKDSLSEPKPAASQFAAWDRVRRQLEKFEPYKLEWNKDPLTEMDRAMLREVLEAARLMDEIFLRQVSSRNVQIRMDLERIDDPAADDIGRFFRIMFGPYDRLEHNRPFINVPRKVKGATFYPANMEKTEFEQWLKDNPKDEGPFRSNFTVIRRTKEKRLAAVPYSEEYREWLEPAAEHLRKAAENASNESLKKFLASRADAFGSNDYFQSDMDWVNVRDNILDVTIGPYEVYEDELLGYKAAFEAFVCLRDPDQSAKLEEIKKHLPDMERNLPIPPEHQNLKRGLKSPVAVVDLIFSAGDAKAGIQTLAFNLPNDEKVREHKDGGAKKVILRNTMNGKYEVVMKRIVPLVVADDQKDLASFDQFFNHTLIHEVSHSLGPGTIQKDGKKTDVGRELKDLYSAIEEAKADTLGMYNSIFLVDKGFFPASARESIWVTFLAGTFRSVRFGATEAHGRANVCIFNYLVEKGGYVRDPSGRFRVDMSKIDQAVRDLAHDLLMIEALGDYDAAGAFIGRYSTMSADMKALVDAVNEADIPVDLEPVFDLDF